MSRQSVRRCGDGFHGGPDDGPVVRGIGSVNDQAVQADSVFIAQFLALVALMAGTIEYCEMLQRRTVSRRFAALREEAAVSGLNGLVRMFVADGRDRG